MGGTEKVWQNADLNLVKHIISDCLSRLASVLINAIFPPSGILSLMACVIKMSLIVTLPPTTSLDNFSILSTASVAELDLRFNLFTMSRALEMRLTLNKLSMSKRMSERGGGVVA